MGGDGYETDYDVEGPTLTLDGRVARQRVLARMFGAHQEPQPVRLGRYEVLSCIGRGAFGAVYRALDPKLRRNVAIKVFDSASLDPIRVEREAQALATLNHPNVVTVHDVAIDTDAPADHRVYMVMEILEGSSAATWLEAGKRTSKEILEVFVKAGEGLKAAHKAGMLHRDFKPGNVVVGSDGDVKVVDFGLARAEEGRTLPDRPTRLSGALSQGITLDGAILGTPAYLAPECRSGHPGSVASDQFSFAASLFAAFTERSPWDLADSDVPVSALDPGELSAALAQVPPRVRRAILRGLSIRPRDRFPTMEELLAQLRPRRRNWRLAVAATVAASVAAVVMSLDNASPRPCVTLAPLADGEGTFAALHDTLAADEGLRASYGTIPTSFAARYQAFSTALEQACSADTKPDSEQRACLEQRAADYRLAAEQPEASHAALDRIAHSDDCAIETPLLVRTAADQRKLETLAAMIAAGEPDRALAQIEEALETASETYGVSLELLRLRILAATCQHDTYATQYRNTLSRIEVLRDDLTAAAAYVQLAETATEANQRAATIEMLLASARRRLPEEMAPPGLQRRYRVAYAGLDAIEDRAREVVEKLEPIVAEATDGHDRTVQLALARYARAAARIGNHGLAKSSAEHLLELSAGEPGAARAVTAAHYVLGRVALNAQRTDEVAVHLAHLDKIASASETACAVVVAAQSSRAILQRDSRDYRSAAASMRVALDAHDGVSKTPDRRSAGLLADYGGTLMLQGDLEGAEKAIRRSLDITGASEPGSQTHRLTQGALAELLWKQKRYTATVELTTELLAAWDPTDDAFLHLGAEVIRSRARLMLDEPVDCEALDKRIGEVQALFADRYTTEHRAYLQRVVDYCRKSERTTRRDPDGPL